MKCAICNIEFSRLGSHIKTHNISIKEYYDMFIKSNDEDICPVCKKENSFLGLTKGYTSHCSLICKGKDPKVKEKVEQTCLDRYGATNVYASEYGKQQIKQTNLERYGVENPQQNLDIKQKTEQTNLIKYGHTNFSNPDKAKQTCLVKYGVDNPAKHKSIQTKIQETTLERYGVKCQFQRPDLREKALSEEAYRKRNETMFKNGNSSSAEDRCYDLIKTVFPNTIRPYKSELYPYLCDFYVPELDLYIECHFFWTHGGHFFDSSNPDDVAIIEEWKAHNTKFYDNAVYNWTVRDLEKLQCAMDNDLNYLVCWSEEEFMSIFDRDFSEHDELPDKIKKVTQVAKLANWNEYFKREIEMLENPLVLGELFINRYKYLGKLPHQLSNLALLNGLSISGKLRKYSTFDNTGMIQFIEKYKPSAIYDPCSGWGERLLTCHQYGIRYLGFDINDKVVEGLNTLIGKYNINATVQCGDSSKNSFASDVLFTCPPYWNTEIYTDKGAENLSYDEFLVWWKSVIQRSNCKIVAYQINQRFKEDMNRQLLDLGYSFIEEIILPQKSSHFTRKDGNQKKEYESIQVFII